MTSATSGSLSVPSVSSGGNGQSLDELMLAMDVVDTLRHQEAVAEREIAQDGRDEGLKERLRRLYESQGLEVSDRILDEGIAALKESRFTYERTPAGLSRTLAGLWVRRGRVMAGIATLIVLFGMWSAYSSWITHSREQAAEAARIELTETLPANAKTAEEAAMAEARTKAAQDRVQQLYRDATLALARADAPAARVAVASLETLRQSLVQTYQLRIVTRQGERSGVFRIPDANTSARNYYLIVEAVTPDGELLSFPIRNEETNATTVVSRWGVRVSQATYEAVRDDKMDDGILQNNILATKPRGALKPVYEMPVSDGAITKW
ncbi:DUF6384 family protein [Breoghania sp.]|uniref:DUF6384 family protein n=1 Tax=Breoghania sp. TaxID=2065378 RepID=UPI002AA6DC84|nr:DUF6384 family protein [Breoghania sp.]